MDSTNLTQQMKGLSLKVSLIENNVLFFLQKNHKDSTNDEIKSACKNSFSDSEICAAKQLLAEDYVDLIRKTDETVANNLCTGRIGQNKLDRVINDTLNAIDALEACENEVTIVAIDGSRIPSFKSESASLKSFMETIKSFEGRLKKAEEEITVLKNENVKLRGENLELRDEIEIVKSSGSSSSNVPSEGVEGSSGDVGVAAIPPPPTQPPTIPATHPPSLGLGTGAALDVPPSGSAKLPKLPRSKLTNKQKLKINEVRIESTLEAVADAMATGALLQDALCIGKTVGEEKASSWAQITKKNNSVTRAAAAAAATPAAGSRAMHFPPLRPVARPTPTAKVTNRNSLKKVSPYKRGGKATGNVSDAVLQKPTFMENKCLVIRGLRKDLTKAKCLAYINETAGRNINVLHLAIISREYSPWMTVAVELNTEDYDLLSDINIWDNSIGIREYIGWRDWHGKRPPRLSPDEIKKSVRMQWVHDGGPI